MPMRTVLIPQELNVPRRYRIGASVARLRGETMGTNWSVQFVRATRMPLAEIKSGIRQCLDAVVSQMSTWLPSSDISVFNRAPAGSWHELPEDFFVVLRHALELARATEGAFDPTVGQVVNAWGFGPEVRPFHALPPGDVAAAMSSVGWRAIELDVERRRAFQPGGAYLDLSAIAKGYGVDKVAADLRDAEVLDFLVEIGGEFRGEGTKPDLSPWWVALESPVDGDGENAAGAQTIVGLHGLSVATSGDYRRCFFANGRRYAHTIDPRTGYPLDGNVASVSVIARTCMEADALATALTVLGESDGMAYATRHDIAAQFVIRENAGYRQSASPALRAMA